MMKHDSQRPVTLEDILRLKRTERPPAEFWDQFDRELRAKQLAALVEKRPWWRTISFPRLVAGVRRYQLPLGATAVLAVTVLSVREYRAPQSAVSAPVVARELQIERSALAPLAVAPAPLANAVESARVEPAVAPALADTAETPSSGSRLAVTSAPAFAGPTSPASVADDSAVVASSRAHPIAEHFAALPAGEPMLSRQLLSPARGFETRVLPARAKPVEPLAQMKVPSGSRRSNVIASATLVSTTAPVLASERSARGLSDERLYETISRVNARGAGMLVKF